MNFLRKFFDVAIEGAGGGDTAVLDKPEVKETVVLSPAQQMAKSGIKSTSDSLAAKPIVNKTEIKEEPKGTEAKPDATSNALQTTEKANSETLTQKEEAEEVIQTQKEPVTQTQPSLQEVLKSQQPDKVLKELGFDDKEVKLLHSLKGFDKIDYFINFVNEWKSGGNVNGYLKELSTDYTKMASEEVMRHQLRVEYPKASDKQLEALYEKEIIELYNLDSEDKVLSDKGRLLLDAKADRYRDKLIENQQTFLMPKAPEAKQPEPDLSEQKAQQVFEAYKSTINTDPYSAKVFEKKQITIGKGEDKFNYPIEPELIKGLLFDTDKWNETQYIIDRNMDGTIKSAVPKIEDQILIASFAQNPQKFLEAYATHLLARGGQKAIEPINNAKPADSVNFSNADSSKPTNPAAAAAKHGVRVAAGV